MKIMNKRYFILFGVLLIVLAIFGAKLTASPIDLVNVSFDKTYYSMVYGDSLKVNYTIENNNSTSEDMLVYADCDEDVLTCDFSRTFKLNANSKIDTSFIVNSIDDGSSNVRFYVKDMKTNDVKDYILRVDVDRYNDEGKFEIDMSKTSFCKDRSQEVVLTFDRVFSNDIYNLSLSSNTLSTFIKGSTDRYLKSDDEVLVNVDTRNVEIGSHTLTLNITNDLISSKKTFNIYVSDCPEVLNPEFTVVGGQTLTHVITKDTPYTLKYIVKNTSLKNKLIFVSQESDNSLNIDFSNRELYLSPGESKEVTLVFTAPKEIRSGDYPVVLSFFDERTTITRNLRFLVQPESNLNIRLLQSSVLLEIGKTFDIGLVIENKGDVLETIYLDTVLSNDLKMNNLSDRITISPNTTQTILLTVSSGSETVEKTSQIEVSARNSSNDYSKRFILDVVTFRPKDYFKVSFLSFPTELTIDSNNSKEFSFEVYNSDDKDIVISKIDILGLPQEANYEITQYTYIPKNSSRVISGKITVGESPLQDYDLTFVFYSNTGAVLSKPVLLKVTDAMVNYKDDDKKSFLTGFFTLSKSVLLGIIFLALLLIILFATGVITTKHKSIAKS